MIVRLASDKDAEGILDVYGPYVKETAVSFKYELPDRKEFAEGIESTLRNHPYLVAVENDAIVGFSYASPFRPHAAYSPSVETTVYVKNGFHGKGIGRALYDELESYLRKQNVCMMNACIAVSEDPDDPYLDGASMGFHTKLGFVLLARIPDCAIKFGRPYGFVWTCKRLSVPSEERPFVPFSETDSDRVQCPAQYG